jgi:hypothetical protein
LIQIKFRKLTPDRGCLLLFLAFLETEVTATNVSRISKTSLQVSR